MQDLKNRLSQLEQSITNSTFLADHYNKTAKAIEKQITMFELEFSAIQQEMQKQNEQETTGEAVNE